jgi:hypothetical protein
MDWFCLAQAILPDRVFTRHRIDEEQRMRGSGNIPGDFAMNVAK